METTYCKYICNNVTMAFVVKVFFYTFPPKGNKFVSLFLIQFLIRFYIAFTVYTVLYSLYSFSFFVFYCFPVFLFCLHKTVYKYQKNLFTQRNRTRDAFLQHVHQGMSESDILGSLN